MRETWLRARQKHLSDARFWSSDYPSGQGALHQSDLGVSQSLHSGIPYLRATRGFGADGQAQQIHWIIFLARSLATGENCAVPRDLAQLGKHSKKLRSQTTGLKHSGVALRQTLHATSMSRRASRRLFRFHGRAWRVHCGSAGLGNGTSALDVFTVAAKQFSDRQAGCGGATGAVRGGSVE